MRIDEDSSAYSESFKRVVDGQTDRQSETNIYPHQENETYNYHKNSTFMSIVTDHNINNHIFIQE